MALVDLEGNYKSAPPKLTYTPQPDPFANYVDETGSPSTANYQAWGTPAPATASAPAGAPTGNRWNSQYQAWEDASGNLWDSASGAWYDPDSGKVWSNNTNSWQTPQENRATWDAILGHDQAISNTLGAQPSGQATHTPNPDFQSAWRAFDRNTVAPTGEYQPPKQTLSGLLMGGVDAIKTATQQANTYGFSPDMPTSLDLERQGRGEQIASQLGTIGATQGESSGLAGKALGAANRYFFDPMAETGAQLTQPALTALRLSNPIAASGDYLLDRAGLPTPFGSPQSQVAGSAADLGELGSTARQSGGNPLKFAELQQENLHERPMWQQLGAQMLFDPTNAIGAGIGAKALKGGIKGEGLLSDILRGAAKVDRGIDAVQAGLFKPVGKVLGALAEPAGRVLAEEGGAVPTKLALKAGAAAGAGGVGYITAPEDASPEEKFLRVLGFAAVPALGPEATDIAARSYGKLPGLADAGLGRRTWLEQAPVTDVLEGKNLNPVIYLKDVTAAAPLPLRTKLSNAFWETLEKVGRKGAAANIDDDKVFRIAMQHRRNEQVIGEVAENMSKVAGEDFARVFTLDDAGRVLDSNGGLLPALDNDGAIQAWKGKDVYGATVADIADHADTYLARGMISDEQHAALRRMADAEQEITALRQAFGLPFEPSPTVGPDGFHLTRGRAMDAAADTTPTRPREPMQEGRTPGGAKPRGYASEAIGILDGKQYPHPVEALRSYLDQSLREVNAANSSHNLGKLAIDVELSTGRQTIVLGDLLKNQAQRDDLAETIKAIRAGKREVRKLSTRKARIDRDVRLGSAWVGTNRNRADKLTALATDQTISASGRAEAAHDALALTKTALNDARSAAADYARLSAINQVRDTEARRALNETLTEANRISKELDKIEDAIRAGETADLQQKVAEAWNYADNIRNATAADAAALERRLADLPYEDVSESSLRAREALARARNNFGDSLADLRKQEAKAIEYAKREATAAANVRAAINEGKVKELNRLVERRAEQLSRLADQSDELQSHIDQLKNAILPLEQSRDMVKGDIRRTIDLAKELSGKFPTGTIKVKGWENIHMPHYMANAWTKYEKGASKVGGKSELFDLFNNGFRMIGATLDASRTATVGLLGLSTDPGPSAKGIKAGLDAAKDPESAWHSLRLIEDTAREEGLPSLAEAVGKYTLEIASSEHMLRGMSDAGTLADRLAKAPGLKHAEALYATPGNIERAQRFYDNLRVLRARGEDWTSDSARSAAANAANVTTGRASRGALAPIVGEAASSRILFAGRFVQSQFDAVYNAIMVGGIEGETARKGLLRLFGGGAALTYAINELQGDKTDFALFKDGRLNPDFMKIRILGQDISLFGPWESLVKGLAATAQGDPDYFLRGKLAPGAGILWDVTVNRWRDPLDRPIDSREGLARMFPVPFGVRSIIEQGQRTDFSDPKSVAGLGLSVATGMLGVKSSPLTPREQYTETLQNAYAGYEPKAWDGSPLKYPQPADVYEDPLFVREYGATHPDKIPGPATALGKEMAAIRDERGAELEALNRKFAADGVPLGTWKDQRSSIKDMQRTQLEPLIKKMQEAIGSDPAEGSPSWWLNKYFQTFEEAKDPETHQLDRTLLDRAQAKFMKETQEAGADWVMDYIDAYTLAGADPGPEREYLEAIQQLDRDGYFDGKIPRYIGMVSGMADDEIYQARGLVAGYAEKHPELESEDYLTKAYVILKPLGYTVPQIWDVSNSGKQDYMNPYFELYKYRNPGLVEWLDDGNFYSTIQAVNGR